MIVAYLPTTHVFAWLSSSVLDLTEQSTSSSEVVPVLADIIAPIELLTWAFGRGYAAMCAEKDC